MARIANLTIAKTSDVVSRRSAKGCPGCPACQRKFAGRGGRGSALRLAVKASEVAAD